MSELTPNLGLFKYDLSTDGKEVFSIEQALNSNWDIIDNMDLLPDQTDKENYVLTTDGVTAHWGETDEIYPVVQTFSNGNSWGWVRSDGWCEQGGKLDVNAIAGQYTITFVKPFSNIRYSIGTTCERTDANYNPVAVLIYAQKTQSSMVLACNQYVGSVYWEVKGYIEV